MEQVPSLRLEQRLKLAPQIIQSIEILQLPLLALEQRINQELVENPVLELRQTSPEEAPSSSQEPLEDRTAEETDFAKLDDLAEDWEDYFSYTSRPRSSEPEEDKKFQAIQNTPAPAPSLQDYLTMQLNLLNLKEDLRIAVENIIYNIDDNGYLRYPIEEIAASLTAPVESGQPSGVSLEKLEEALKIVQGLDPPGVGARSLKECLLLQLSGGEPPLARKIIEDHLEDVQKNLYPRVARALGVSIEEVKEAVEFIGHLNPYPGALFSGESAHYVLPDVIVEVQDGEYEVRLEERLTSNIFISSYYRRLLQSRRGDPKVRSFVRKKMQAARWLIDAIEQRRNTLFKIANALVEFQKEFLEKGVAYLKPLKMQEVADVTGVHVSTVSRAISGKYIQTPFGIYEMKFFFAGGPAQKPSGPITRPGAPALPAREKSKGDSWKAVKYKISQLVAKEDKKNPLSDEEIVKKLRAEGTQIARRTVAKYRRELGLPSSRRRREY
jgi:RNA polymerase sigma-54 factor